MHGWATVYSFVRWWISGLCPLLAVLMSAAMDIRVQASIGGAVLILLVVHLGMESLDHMLTSSF